MIGSFAHTGLRKFFETGSRAGILPTHAGKLRVLLGLLSKASSLDQMELHGLHALAGKRKGEWSLHVSGNWRLTFRFENGQAIGIRYEDYH